MSENFFERSGDDDFDRALIAELKRIVYVLEINPGFKYNDSMNSIALYTTIVPGTNGTVILALALMRKLMQDVDGGAGVAGVCAHQCGHIYQFQHGLIDRIQRNTKGLQRQIIMELHADFIAGYYMGRRKEFAADQIKKFSSVIWGLSSIHDTPGKRSAAVERGYRVGSDGETMAKAAEIGLSYVMNL